MDEKNKAAIRKVKEVAERLALKLPYHNFLHELDVYGVVSKYVRMYGLSPENSLVLKTAALLHDTREEEDKTVELVSKLLPKLGYNLYQTSSVGELIASTKLAHAPRNLLEEILKDADLDNLGRKDFFERNNLLRRELGKQEVSDYEWYSQTLKFLQNHEYYTKAAQELRNPGLKQNIARVESYLKLMGDKDAA